MGEHIIIPQDLPLFKLVTYKASYTITRNGNGTNSGQMNIAPTSFVDSHNNTYSSTLANGYKAVGFTWFDSGANTVALCGINLSTTQRDITNGYMARVCNHENMSGSLSPTCTINVLYMLEGYPEHIMQNPNVKPIDIRYVETSYSHTSSISASGGSAAYLYTAYDFVIPHGYYIIGLTRFDTGTKYCILSGAGPFLNGRCLSFSLANASTNTQKRMIIMKNPSASARTPGTAFTFACIPEEYVLHPNGIAGYDLWGQEGV